MARVRCSTARAARQLAPLTGLWLLCACAQQRSAGASGQLAGAASAGTAASARLDAGAAASDSGAAAAPSAGANPQPAGQAGRAGSPRAGQAGSAGASARAGASGAPHPEIGGAGKAEQAGGGGSSGSPSSDGHACRATRVPVPGSFQNIYDPSVGQPWPYYINDHTIARATDGSWHLFGITHAEPANPAGETEFAHASSPSLTSPGWMRQENALRVDPSFGEIVLWAPFVMTLDGRYYMFYCGGYSDYTQFQIELATSTDMFHWTREPAPLFRDGYGARDPVVLKIGDDWVMYYTATDEIEGGHHVVAYRKSQDLKDWSERRVAYTDRQTGMGGGTTESPFVVQRGDGYYLLIGPRDRYNATTVLFSRDPFEFHEPQITELPAHAPEIVVDDDGQDHVSRAGWGEHGTWLAPLAWEPSRCEQHEANDIGLELRTEPSAGLTSLTLGGRELLGVGFDVPGPFVVASGAEQPIKPGVPKEIERAADGSRVVLRGMPLGQLPIEVDWAVCFREDGFDQRIQWRVTQDVVVSQVGWSLSVGLDDVGDAQSVRLQGERLGFGEAAIASDSASSVVVAYAARSAFAEASRAFDAGFVSYRSLSDALGRAWPAGTYPGGLYRITLSGTGRDVDRAAATSSQLAQENDACAL